MKINVDFHIHSCLSGCAELENSPTAIVARAEQVGLDVLCLTDHNSAANCPAFAQACEGTNLTPFFGVEVNTREEVHVLCIYEQLASALQFGSQIRSLLPMTPNMFGDQVVVNEQEEVLELVDIFLNNAADIGVDELFGLAGSEALIIPSHVDRQVFGLVSQLGFIPKRDYAALEIYRSQQAKMPLEQNDYTLVSNSDGHCLADIGRYYNRLEVEEISVAGVRAALKAGRSRIIAG